VKVSSVWYLSDDIGVGVKLQPSKPQRQALRLPAALTFINLSPLAKFRKARTTLLEHCAIPVDLCASRVSLAQNLALSEFALSPGRAFRSLAYLSSLSQLTTRQRLSLSTNRQPSSLHNNHIPINRATGPDTRVQYAHSLQHGGRCGARFP
jgi:hypothetical protein